MLVVTLRGFKMSNRITQKNLEKLCNCINDITANARTPYTKMPDGTYKTNIGNYHLDYAYGGVKLVRMCGEHGGIRTISTGGYGTKKELYHWMEAFLAGLNCN
jgi:hypothetical protein